ncbi:putative ribonuclease H-like domain-containing protein [Tanacetum coccineum]
MRNKSDINEIDIDDLYNNLRVYEDEKKSTNEVSTASGDIGVSTAGGTSQVPSTLCAHDVAYSFFAQPTTSPQLENEDFQQIDGDDLEELDLRWQCYNYHRKGHFARECRSGRNQWRRSYGDNGRSNAPINYIPSQAPGASRMANVRSSDEESTPVNDMISKVDEYHVVPPPITRNFLTPRADISFTGLDEYAIRKKIIDRNSKNEDDVSEVQTVSLVKTNESQIVKPKVDKIGQTFQKQGIGFKKIKACFVCKSTNHLIKDCNFYDKKSQEPKLKNVVNTGPRVNKPIWDNAKRVNHQKFSNKLKYPHLRKTFVPSGVLTRTGLITPVKQNEKRAVHTISTARPWIIHAQEGNPTILLQDHAVVDSGYSSHMTGNKAYLLDYEDFNGGFMAFESDPKGGKIMSKGKIKTSNLDFDDVYFVDELKFNLFSVSQMCDKKNSVLFTETECLILSPSFKLLDESQVVLRAPRKDDVYSLDLKNIVPSGGITCLYANATADESKLWHRRLGHVNFKNINKLVKGHLVRGLPSKVFVNDHTCVACKKGKQHKASCKAKLERIIRKPLELLHMDLFGPVSVESINKKRYCLVVTDDFSRFSWVFFLATKDETSEILCKFIIGLENQLNHNVKIIRCDNGTEFKNHAMNELCAEKGIKREFSAARTP